MVVAVIFLVGWGDWVSRPMLAVSLWRIFKTNQGRCEATVFLGHCILVAEMVVVVFLVSGVG